MPPTLRQAPLSCPGHTRPVVDLQFCDPTDCGPLFLTAAKDGKAILRRGDTGDWIGTFSGHKGAVWACAMDKQGTKAATGAADFTAKLWDVNTGAELLSICEEHIVRSIDLSRTDSGGRLITANNRKKVSVYDLASPEQPLLTLLGHEQLVRRTLWCDDDRRVLTISEDKKMRLWDLVGGDTTQPVLSTPLWTNSLDDVPYDLLLSPLASSQQSLEIRDGPQMAVLACGKTVHLFELDWRQVAPVVPDGRIVASMNCAIYTAALHPTEQVLVCGGEDHVIYRLDVNDGSVLESCKGHFGPVHCVRFSPDGRIFASGSEDGTVRLWQTQVGDDFGLWQLDKSAEETVAKAALESCAIETDSAAIVCPVACPTDPISA